MMAGQPGQQVMEEPVYREQPQLSRSDWSQMMQQQSQLPPMKPNPVVWPEKLAKQAAGDEKAGRKKGSARDSEYSEEYSEGDESQAEGDDSTTTEAPKKVKLDTN